jgi:phospholipid transport system substrate-binding protein
MNWDMIRKPACRLVGGALGASFLIALPLMAAPTATDSVKTTITEVIRVLEDQGLKQPDRTEERRRRLEKIIGDRFSYDEMAKRSLGAQWAKLSDGERQEFVELFRGLLTRSYIGKIEGYSGEQIHYLTERLQEGYAEVKTKLATGKTVIPLDYRLLNKSGDWRVYDVVVDGISLVNNYRGQFAKVIRSSSYQGLVDKLRNRSETFAAPKTDDKAK